MGRCLLKEERNKKYLYLLAGYGGLMFLGVAILRNLLFFQDTLGYVLTTFGYIFLVSYVKFADEKIGATKRDKIILEQDLWLFLEWLPSTFINSVPLTVGQNIKFEG